MKLPVHKLKARKYIEVPNSRNKLDEGVISEDDPRYSYYFERDRVNSK